MAHTFDIRFDRSTGFASLFEAPANGFRWKGGGILKIDPHGVSIDVKRSLPSLLARRRTQRISAADLTEVYREGKALRVEFTSAGKPREVVPFWVRDRETAAEIVKLLPTSRTVEMEHSIARDGAATFRTDWRMISLFGGTLLALIGIAIVLNAYRSASPVPMLDHPALEIEMPDVGAAAVSSDSVAPAATAKLDEATPSFLVPAPAKLAAPTLPGTDELANPDDLALQIPRGTRAYSVAREHARLLDREAARIETDYRIQHKRFMSRDITTDEFIAKLDDCEMRWWEFTFRILDDDAIADPDLAPLRAAVLAAARHSRNFYARYAEGLREGDHVKIALSFDELTLAEELRARIRHYFIS